MSLHKNDDGTLEFTDGMTKDVLRVWTKTPCCVDGWVPGEFGIERCDDCARFECDEDAAKHVIHVIDTLEANGYLDKTDTEQARLAIYKELHPDKEEGDDE